MVEKASNRDRAVELRKQGLSRSQICEALGLKSGGRALSEWLRDVPPPEWTKRPNAKDDMHARAVALRKEGKSYREIGEVIHVSTSTLSLWLRDVPLTSDQEARLYALEVENGQRRGMANRARRLAKEAKAISDAREQIPQLAESELFVAGVAAYWCEGAKAKPWRTHSRVQFINSDPGLIRLFCRWLELVGVETGRITYRVAIHRGYDERVAREYWAAIVGASPDAFYKTTFKKTRPSLRGRRHYPADYQGCLVIAVRRSTDLYRQIAGWWAAIVDAAVA